MGVNTAIAWTDNTWNPWQGCRKVSPGCEHCYMYRDKKRFGQDPTKIHRSKDGSFYLPTKWKKPARVFVCSWSDFFIEEADQWRDETWDIMRSTPHLTYQILTKRPENISSRLPDDWPLVNVWIGVTAENQTMANRRLIDLIFKIDARVKFVSVEPMLGPVNLLPYLRYLDWVIVGGESGPHARVMKPEWASKLMNDCRATNTPFFMKQMSRRQPIPKYLQCRQFPR